MKKIFIPLLLLIFVLTGIAISRFFFTAEDTWTCVDNQWIKHGSPKNPPPETGCGKFAEIKLTPEIIASEFARKYNRPQESYLIEIQINTGKFAKGSVRLKDEFGGALWFAAKTEKGWELAADGQGPMKCEVADTYNFPKELVPSCIKGDTLRQR